MSSGYVAGGVPRQHGALRVTHAGRTTDFVDGPVLVGRDRTAHVVVPHEDASRRHLEFRRHPDGWAVVDLGSTNGTFLDGRRITHDRLTGPATVGVGGPQTAVLTVEVVAAAPAGARPPAPPSASWVPTQGPGAGAAAHRAFPPSPPQAPPGQLAHGHTVVPAGRGPGQVLTIGRTRSNDIVLDDPLVSRQHATLELGRPAVLRDLHSFNGTFVNGRRVAGAVQLAPGDEVIFGNQTFTWDGDQLSSRVTRRDLTLFAEGLTTVVGDGKRLLDGVSFELGPSSLTAVIGPSGAGKSTLLGALTGLRPATHGNVGWQGHDLYTHYDQLRFQIGLVPQQDIQHPQLTVRQGLSYAAELRLPPDTTRDERARRVSQVVGQLQLERQADNRIGTQLSGGQRKRVSIATELLTAPPLLFLDEPTSGLDPGLDRDVMHQLRTLADEGRVVVVVTHSVLALDVCDNVVVLAPGGRLAYFGPPDGVLGHFGCRDYPEVFDLLDEPDLWRRIPPPVTPHLDTARLPPANAAVPPPVRQSMTRQLSTLTRRNLAVTMADKLLLAMLVVLPVVLGGLSRVVQGDAGLSLERARTDEGVLTSGEALQRLTILVVAAALMGVAITIRELVKERAIFQREYAVGLSPGTYLTSKIVVLGTAAFLQGVVVTLLATVGIPGPDGGGVLGLGRLEVAFAIGALGLVMAVVGLAVSAVVTSSEQTMPALVGLVMVQLVLSGSLVAVHGRPILEQVAWLAPARWGFAASGVSVDLERPDAEVGLDTDPLLRPDAVQWFADLTALGVLCGIAVGAGLWLVRRSSTPR